VRNARRRLRDLEATSAFPKGGVGVGDAVNRS